MMEPLVKRAKRRRRSGIFTPLAFWRREGKHRVERRLAATLPADVAGYSRLIGANAFATLRTH
jgi:hypothetical protein